MGQAIADTVPLCADRIGQGEPLLLLHGGNADRSQFAVFTPHLGGGIQAIALDQRDSRIARANLPLTVWRTTHGTLPLSSTGAGWSGFTFSDRPMEAQWR
ncbi:alpha/beta fold hydrolase [Novosphingobium resinovorum]